MYYGFLDPAKTRDYCAIVILKVVENKLKLASLRLLDNVNGANAAFIDRFYTSVVKDFSQWMQHLKRELVLGLDTSNETMLAEGFRAEGFNVKELKFTQPLKDMMKQNLTKLWEEGKITMPDPSYVKDPNQKTWIKELHLQLTEQERLIKQGGRISYRHPPGRHDDLIIALEGAAWLAKSIFFTGRVNTIVMTKGSDFEAGSFTGMSYAEPFMNKPGIKIRDEVVHCPGS